jgi:hypothetical protein
MSEWVDPGGPMICAGITHTDWAYPNVYYPVLIIRLTRYLWMAERIARATLVALTLGCTPNGLQCHIIGTGFKMTSRRVPIECSLHVIVLYLLVLHYTTPAVPLCPRNPKAKCRLLHGHCTLRQHYSPVVRASAQPEALTFMLNINLISWPRMSS